MDFVYSTNTSSRSIFAGLGSTAAIDLAPFLDAGEHVPNERAAAFTFHLSGRTKRRHQPRQRRQGRAAARAVSEVAPDAQASPRAAGASGGGVGGTRAGRLQQTHACPDAPAGKLDATRPNGGPLCPERPSSSSTSTRRLPTSSRCAAAWSRWVRPRSFWTPG